MQTTKLNPLPLGICAALTVLMGVLYGVLPPMTGEDLLPLAAQLVPLLPVCWLTRARFTGAVRELRDGRPGPDTLTAASALLLLGYDCCGAVLLILGTPLRPAPCGAWPAVVLTLGSIVQLPLERRRQAAEQRNAAFLGLLPDTARVLRDGKPVNVSAAELTPGDVLLLRPGERLPADAVVIQGETMLTRAVYPAEAKPVAAEPGLFVSAGSQNGEGALACTVTAVGPQTIAARLAATGEHGADPAVEQTARRFVLAALLMLLFVLLFLATGRPVGEAVVFAAAVLAAAAPTAARLVSADPTAALLRRGAVGDLRALEAAKTVLIEQPGVVTQESPGVTAVVGTRSVPAKFLLGIAAGLAVQTDTPFAKAIVEHSTAEGVSVRPAQAFAAEEDGMTGKVAGKVVAGGSIDFLADRCQMPDDLRIRGEALQAEGAEVMYFALDGHAAGLVAFSDAPHEGVREALQAMQEMGLEVLILSPDSPGSAARLANQLGLRTEQIVPKMTGQATRAEVTRRAQAGAVAFMTMENPISGTVNVALRGWPVQAQTALLSGTLSALPDVLQTMREADRHQQAALRTVTLGQLAALILTAAIAFWVPEAAPLAGSLLSTLLVLGTAWRNEENAV